MIFKLAKKYNTGIVLTSFTKRKTKPQNSAFVINKQGKILMKYSKVLKLFLFPMIVF